MEAIRVIKRPKHNSISALIFPYGSFLPRARLSAAYMPKDVYADAKAAFPRRRLIAARRSQRTSPQ
jgi:hypothetical protein